MDNIDDVRTAMRCEDAFKRAKEYKDKARYEIKYHSMYISQLKMYHHLLDKIKNPIIKQELEGLESKL